MIFNIIPYVAAGPLRFGMKRAAIQALLGPKGVPISPGGKAECDYYHSLGIMVEYDDNLECSYIALSKPVSAIYKGKDLLCLNSKQVIKLLENDSNIEVSDDTLISRLHGIGAVFEYKTKPVERVTVFKKGYYNNYDEQKKKLETLNLNEMSDEDIWNFINNG